MTPSSFGWTGHEPVETKSLKPDRTPAAADPQWVQLMVLMAAAPARGVSISGTVMGRLYPEDMGGYGDGPELDWLAAERPAPDADVPIVGPLWRVWRSGTRVRIEDADGRLHYLCDGASTWFFDADLGEWEANPGVQSIFWRPPGTPLLYPKDLTGRRGDDYADPTGPPVPDRYLGRPVWRVELAATSRKPLPLSLLVDQDTGVVLRSSSADDTVYETWVTFSVDIAHAGQLYWPPNLA